MKTFLLQAPRTFADAEIPEGFVLQVPSRMAGNSPDMQEVKDALHRAGFYGRADGWASPGNWIVRELK